MRTSYTIHPSVITRTSHKHPDLDVTRTFSPKHRAFGADLQAEAEVLLHNRATQKESVERAFYVQDAAQCYVRVAFGGADAGMSQKRLDVADVGAVFQKVRRVGVAEAVN